MNYTLCWHAADTAPVLHALVISDLLDEDANLSSPEDDETTPGTTFNERDYFITLEHVLNQIALRVIERDDTMNQVQRASTGNPERDACGRIVVALNQLMQELQIYRDAGYLPRPPRRQYSLR
jgi:hypothetical protein